MSATLFFDAAISDDERRARLYAGDIFVYSPSAASKAFCSFASSMIEEAFEDKDPQTVQQRIEVARYVEILKTLKPAFIHHDESKRHIQNLLTELRCDLDDTYFDVPRMRSSTSDGYLTTGIAYAWHPHRDTWYSAPPSQINFWLPILDIEADNTVAFHTRYFDSVVSNDSKNYNYYEWNKKFRAAAASQVGKETRPLPGPKETVERESETRIVCPAGGIILFSGAHLHSSVPNTSGKTRFSIDFRTVSAQDIAKGLSAPTQDVECTGSSIRDFLRASDFAGIPDDVVARFADGTEAQGDLVYSKSG